MTVMARLEGNVFDLDALVELFAEGEPQVSKEAEGYYLASAELEGLIDDGGRLLATASQLLQHTTGVARALDSSFRPVTLSGQFVDTSGEGKRHHVVVAGTAEVRCKAMAVGVVTAASQPAPLAPPPGPALLQLARGHADVADALDILGQSSVSLSWNDLWKVFEIVRHNVGGGEALAGKGWTSPADAKAFKQSANHPAISGAAARHARRSDTPSGQTMTLAEGEGFIRQLVVAWWDSLA
ncbi:hypothetical protein [Streptomyces sp. MZ04]|uniref:hypothetical protein n=1 Tax=Streptomyces sp. MZ04 TaxID=2559236 RepID=UPI00107EE199|nr:hypothetical protein [Streptomyces sp. MZ04]TGB14397.1 hypothetical protein E2651_06115 [Streptomyces sp. MZ04]